MSHLALCAKSKQVRLEDPCLRDILNHLDMYKKAWKKISLQEQINMQGKTFISFSYTDYKNDEHSIHVHSCKNHTSYWVTVSFKSLGSKKTEAVTCQYLVKKEDVYSFVAVYAIQCLWTLMKVTALETIVL